MARKVKRTFERVSMRSIFIFAQILSSLGERVDPLFNVSVVRKLVALGLIFASCNIFNKWLCNNKVPTPY